MTCLTAYVAAMPVPAAAAPACAQDVTQATSGGGTLAAGVAYAPKQEALGRWYDSGADDDAGVHYKPGKNTGLLSLIAAL